MTHGKHQFANGVDVAVQITSDLLRHMRGNHVSDRDAISDIARQARLTAATVRRFVQPSRSPKSVGFDVIHGLRGAYLRFLRKQLVALDLEIARVEALDPHDAALAALVDDAKALIAKAEALKRAIEE